MVNQIPDIVIGRLPIYLRALTHLEQKGETNTSSQELGQRLNISSAQIRKDLSHFGEFGKQGTGYNIKLLISELRKILNLEHEWPVAIIGAGYLGHALANYQGFQQRGFSMSWVFDLNKKLVGEEMGGLIVKHIDELEQVVKQEGVQVGIIAVPALAAQDVADRLVKTGIKAIINYAPINLRVPKDVQIRYSDPVIQMQHMTYYLSMDNDS